MKTGGVVSKSFAALCAVGVVWGCAPDAETVAERVQAVTTSSQPPAPYLLALWSTNPDEVIKASVVLRARNIDELERFTRDAQDPTRGTWHRFLSTQEFVDRFAPSPGELHRITAALESYGLHVDEVYDDHLLLRVTGTVGAFNQAFAVDMTDYQHGGQRIHRPRHRPTFPSSIRDALLTVEGLDTLPSTLHPHHQIVARPLATASTRGAAPTPGAAATGVPGYYTVGDIANLYNINPVYAAGVTGAGRTVGVVTLAGFDPNDAFAYWSALGIAFSPDRITRIPVDGGAGASPYGQIETTLDVQQAGGLAPGARVLVYEAPQSIAGLLDGFYRAVSDNAADSLSVSWGQTEAAYFACLSNDTCGITDATAFLAAQHQVFLEAGAQGISVFAAAGDEGAYDVAALVQRGVPFSVALTVDSPASDPAITAAGGTTAASDFPWLPPGSGVVVPAEQVWGAAYLIDFFTRNGLPVSTLFPLGTGGGVSAYWPAPSYQSGVAGMRTTEPGQQLFWTTGEVPQLAISLPAGFAGRNLPDVSLNADPYTGYLIYQASIGGWQWGGGGTSFVAPQLNGISALIAQATGGRVGFWNPMLYRYQRQYRGRSGSPLRDITAGDNWFYTGVPGYEPGAGLGTLDVANLVAAVSADGARGRD